MLSPARLARAVVGPELNKALTFASQYDEITENEKAIVMKAKQFLLFNRSTTWRKKTSDSLFDVTMGSFDGAETCELVGAYLLSQLSAEYGNDIGLYGCTETTDLQRLISHRAKLRTLRKGFAKFSATTT